MRLSQGGGLRNEDVLLRSSLGRGSVAGNRESQRCRGSRKLRDLKGALLLFILRLGTLRIRAFPFVAQSPSSSKVLVRPLGALQNLTD